MKFQSVAKFVFCMMPVLSGCSHWDLGETVNIYIEEQDFNDNQLSDIHEAISEWNKTLNGFLTFHYVSGKGTNNLIVIRGKSVQAIKKEHTYWMAETVTVPWENGGGIVMPTNLPTYYQKYFYRAVLHELGHALNMDHVMDYSVMNPTAEGQPPHLICEDITNFCAMNYSVCDSKDFPLCQKNNDEQRNYL